MDGLAALESVIPVWFKDPKINELKYLSEMKITNYVVYGKTEPDKLCANDSRNSYQLAFRSAEAGGMCRHSSRTLEILALDKE